MTIPLAILITTLVAAATNLALLFRVAALERRVRELNRLVNL